MTGVQLEDKCETLVLNRSVMLPIVREHFNAITGLESFRSYTTDDSIRVTPT
jgi:hypothetical protein